MIQKNAAISWTEQVTNEEVFNKANSKPTLRDGLLNRRLAFHGHLERKTAEKQPLAEGQYPVEIKVNNDNIKEMWHHIRPDDWAHTSKNTVGTSR